jgi:hypothetical protein
LAVIGACMGIATFAFAVPPNQLGRGQSVIRQVLFSWENQSRDGTGKVDPVVVTWSADYAADIFQRGDRHLDTRASPQFGKLDPSSNPLFRSRMIQWVVRNDWTDQGNNTITLCGGGSGAPMRYAGFRMLAVTIAK